MKKTDRVDALADGDPLIDGAAPDGRTRRLHRRFLGQTVQPRQFLADTGIGFGEPRKLGLVVLLQRRSALDQLMALSEDLAAVSVALARQMTPDAVEGIGELGVELGLQRMALAFVGCLLERGIAQIAEAPADRWGGDDGIATRLPIEGIGRIEQRVLLGGYEAVDQVADPVRVDRRRCRRKRRRVGLGSPFGEGKLRGPCGVLTQRYKRSQTTAHGPGEALRPYVFRSILNELRIYASGDS